MRHFCLPAMVFGVAFAGRLTAQPTVEAQKHDDRVEFSVGQKPLATFVWKDPKILRPYLAHVTVQGTRQVTRTHPPKDGFDLTDHDTMHPGIWLAFSSFGGHDFWRNKARVEAEDVQVTRRAPNKIVLTARCRYLGDGREICQDQFSLAVEARSESLVLFDWLSQLSAEKDITFDDVEEMGLGIRVATPITVKQGGRMINSDGLVNEKQIRGKQADWCDYSGTLDGVPVGITIVPSKDNFRRSYFHARDYGMLAANPFGRRTFTGGEDGSYRLAKGDTLRLGFRVIVHAGHFSPGEFVHSERSR